jgi:phosphatidylglycerol lysyltransferase
VSDLSLRLRRLAPLLSVAVFGLALWVLHRELAHLHWHDLSRQLHALPMPALVAAVILTIVSYLVLTGYDRLALSYIGRRLGTARPALASFLGYAISQNVGMTLISGAPIRFRLYSAWGLTAVDVAALVAFNALTFWLGLITVSGAAFVIGGGAVPAALHLPFASLRPVGWLLLALAMAYLAACVRLRRPLELGGRRLELPSTRIALLQLALSAADWTVSASVLWVLLPDAAGIGFAHFLTAFLLAQLAGLASQVPGGLGIFETVVISLLPVGVDPGVVLGSLVAYRVVYYLLPLAVAVAILAVYELQKSRQQVARLSGTISSALTLVAPPLLAVTTFLGGAVLLVSGATPAASDRLHWLGQLLPLPALELSHFLGSVVGVLLLLLAWGVRRRLTSAYYLAEALLLSGAVLSLLKGGDYEEASVLAAMALVLAPTRHFFHRKTSLLSEPLSLRWLAAAAMVVVGALWIGLFAFRHVDYSGELWWQFTLHGEASRFLRAGVGMAMALITFGVARLFGPPAPHDEAPNEEQLERVRAVAAASPRASAKLALLGDKRFLLSATGRSFVMYGVQGRSWIAMGEPVGEIGEREDLMWSFHAIADRHGGWTVFYELDEDSLPLALDLGLTALRIGEQAVVRLDRFSLDGAERKQLRYVRNKLERAGCVVEVAPPEAVPDLLPELRTVSDAWLVDKSTREKGFSLGRFDDGYLRQLPIAVVRHEGRVVAFANLWVGAPGGELSVDLMRHLPDAPQGVMDFLFLHLMEWGREQGFASFDLGMAPLAGIRSGPAATAWNRLASLAYSYGESIYNFRGLRQYKDKFDPEWRPRFLACPGGRAVPVVLADLASLISGGLLGVVRK